MRIRVVAGNWKMNGSLASNGALLQALRAALPASDKAKWLVCPPFPYLMQARDSLAGSSIAWGAQDVSQFESGAYTGSVAAAMVVDLGCSHAIVGHSERRSVFGDDDVVVALKFAAALKAGLTPILCVGETLEERESGRTEQVVAGQLDAVLRGSGVKALQGAVVAYEPVWAIGTGLTATPGQAQAVHAFLRSRVAAADAGVAAGLSILYGGSVKAGNAAELFAMPDIDGGLIGGASLQADEFIAICRAALAAG